MAGDMVRARGRARGAADARLGRCAESELLALPYRFEYYRIMKQKQALSGLSALAHETRLALFRLLVREGPSGLPAGDIAMRLGVPPPTLSFHLKELERSGLIAATRRHRQILYAADYAGMRALIGFIMRDCCQGRPELCDGFLTQHCDPEESARPDTAGPLLAKGSTRCVPGTEPPASTVLGASVASRGSTKVD